MNHPRPQLDRYVIPDMPSADELLPYLRQIDSNRWYSNFGPLVLWFERRLTEHLAAREAAADTARYGDIHLATFMTCYDALRIGLQLFHLPPKAHVLVPAVTFPACPLAVQHAGAVPVFADVAMGSWQLTPEIARRVAAKMPIHAVMPVAVYGAPVPTEAWDDFVEETGIPVIIDAAAAFESQGVPRKCLVAHSLHATKPFCVGEGGLLVCRRPDWIDEARCLSNFGTRRRITEENGSNAKMSEYHAAIGHAQLDRWPQVKERRHAMYLRVRAAIEQAGLDLAFQEGVEKGIVSVLMLQTRGRFAVGIVNELNRQNVMAHRMYLPPLYHHPHFSHCEVVNHEGDNLSGNRDLSRKAALMTVCETMEKTLFGIPFHAFLDDEDIAFMVKLLTHESNHMHALIG